MEAFLGFLSLVFLGCVVAAVFWKKRRRHALIAMVVVFLGIVILASQEPSDKGSAKTAAAESGQQKNVPPSKQQAEIALAVAPSADGIYIVGRTDLPEGVSFLVSVETKSGRELAQGHGPIGKAGLFVAGPFTNGDKLFPPGAYAVSLTTGIDSVQPEKLVPVIGKDWSNFTGDLLVKSDYGTSVEMQFPFTLKRGDVGKTEYTTVAPQNARIGLPDENTVKQAIAESKAAHLAAQAKLVKDAYYTCRYLVRKNLKDPGSADFLTPFSPDLVKTVSGGKYAVLMKVRAKNSFGAKDVSTFRCVAHEEDDGSWVADDIHEYR